MIPSRPRLRRHAKQIAASRTVRRTRGARSGSKLRRPHATLYRAGSKTVIALEKRGAKRRAARRVGGKGFVLTEFAHRYERLTDVVCEAARFGCCPRLESEYTAQREWIREMRGPIIVWSLGAPSALKAAEWLETALAPASLEEMLAGDDGGLIARMSRISEAVYSAESQESRQR